MQIIRKNKNSLRTFPGIVPILLNSPFFKVCKQTYSQLHGHCLFFKSVSFNFYITYFLCCLSNFLFFFSFSFFYSGAGFPLYPENFLLYFTMILQRICRIIVGDAGYEPGTSAPEVWRAPIEPPHLQMSHYNFQHKKTEEMFTICAIIICSLFCVTFFFLTKQHFLETPTDVVKSRIRNGKVQIRKTYLVYRQIST